MRPQLWQLYTLAPNAQTALLNRGICLIKAPAGTSLAPICRNSLPPGTNCFVWVFVVLRVRCDGFVRNSDRDRSLMGVRVDGAGFSFVSIRCNLKLVLGCGVLFLGIKRD